MKKKKTYLSSINLIMTNRPIKKIALPLIISSLIFFVSKFQMTYKNKRIIFY